MLKGIIFDMDGVLINSEPLHYQCWKEALKRRGIELEYEVYKPCIGSTIGFLMELLSESYGVNPKDENLVREMGKVKEEHIAHNGYAPLIAFVPELLKRLKDAGYLLAIASSSPEKYIRAVTKAHKIEDYFTVLCSGENVRHPKPAPDVFLKAASMLGLSPEECLVIEDSKNGCCAAKDAGMVCIGFQNPDSGQQDLSTAGIIVEGFEEIDTAFVERAYRRFHNIPVIIGEGQRILLREMTWEDIPKVWEICQEKDIKSCCSDFEGTVKESQEAFLAYKKFMYNFWEMGFWVICDKNSGEILGRAGFEPKNRDGAKEAVIEMGYMIRKQYRKMGYAYEACRLVLQEAHRLGIKKVYCCLDRQNEASAGLAKKLGFREERVEWSVEGEDKTKDMGWYGYSL